MNVYIACRGGGSSNAIASRDESVVGRVQTVEGGDESFEDRENTGIIS